jgi:hypothetical protein
MRKYLVAAAAAPLLAASSGVLRRPKIRGVRTYDVGLQSCEWWTAHIEDRDKNVGTYMMSWVQGFLSGAKNLYQAPLPFISTEAMTEAINAWCRANPTRGVEEAAGALVLSLKAKAAQQ